MCLCSRFRLGSWPEYVGGGEGEKWTCNVLRSIKFNSYQLVKGTCRAGRTVVPWHRYVLRLQLQPDTCSYARRIVHSTWNCTSTFLFSPSFLFFSFLQAQRPPVPAQAQLQPRATFERTSALSLIIYFKK